jgi:hypothetical protein
MFLLVHSLKVVTFVAMTFIAVFLVVFFFLAVVVGPLCRVEDRPAFKWPDKEPRRMV